MFLSVQNLNLLILNKNNAPHECGNPKCKAIALGCGYRTNNFLAIIDISRLLRLQTGGQGAIASGVRHQCRTAPTRMRRARRRSIVKAAALYTNWLAPGFNIDSCEFKHSFIKVQTAFVKLSRQDCLCDRELTSTPNNSSGTLAKTIKTIN
jgi:hypothetical protein